LFNVTNIIDGLHGLFVMVRWILYICKTGDICCWAVKMVGTRFGGLGM